MNTWRYFILRKNKRLSYEEKLKICELYDKGEGTHRGLAKQFGIDKTTIQQLYFKYKNFGAETLHMKRTHQSYTETFKHIVIASFGLHPDNNKSITMLNTIVILFIKFPLIIDNLFILL